MAGAGWGVDWRRAALRTGNNCDGVPEAEPACGCARVSAAPNARPARASVRASAHAGVDAATAVRLGAARRAPAGGTGKVTSYPSGFSHDYQLIPRAEEFDPEGRGKWLGCFVEQEAEKWEADVDPPLRALDLPIPEVEVVLNNANFVLPYDEDVFLHNAPLSGKIGEGTGYLGADCWVDENSWVLDALYPDFAPYIGADGLGMSWVALLVDEPTGVTQESKIGDLDYAEPMWRDYGMCKLLFPVSALHFFAACDMVVESEGPVMKTWRLRYWVGVVHHPSLFANTGTDGVPRGDVAFDEGEFEATQDYGAHGIDDLPIAALTYDGASFDTLAYADVVKGQAYMTMVERVDVTLFYRGASVKSGTRDEHRDDWRMNHREYPRAGSYFYSSDPHDSVNNDGYYWGDNRAVAAWGAVAGQITTGEAVSFIGNMLRGEVRFVLEKDMGWDDRRIRAEGFKCLFGSEVAVEFCVSYVPLYTDYARTVQTCMVRRVLSPKHLEDARTMVDTALELADRGRYERVLYQRWDYAKIKKDLL